MKLSSSKRIVYIGVVVALALTGLGSETAYAETDPPTPISGTLTPDEEQQLQDELKSGPEVTMYYHGEKVDPSSNVLDNAAVCAEVSEDGTTQCFDSEQESNAYLAKHAPTEQARQGAKQLARMRKASDCPNSYVCVWRYPLAKGRRLQWPRYSSAKTRHLKKYGFRDKVSSAYVNRVQRGVTLYDFRAGMPDPKLVLGAGFRKYGDFQKYSYPYGGDWDNKADAIKF